MKLVFHDTWVQVPPRPTRFKIVTPEGLAEMVGVVHDGPILNVFRERARAEGRYIRALDLICILQEAP